MRFRDYLITAFLSFIFIVVSVIAIALWAPDPPKVVCLGPINCFVVGPPIK